MKIRSDEWQMPLENLAKKKRVNWLQNDMGLSGNIFTLMVNGLKLEQKLGKKKVHLEVEIGVFQIVNEDTSTPPYSTWDLLLLPIILLHS